MGVVWGKGMLSDSHAWYKQTANAQGWYVIDLGTVRDVGGVAMRARSDAAQWVKKYSVAGAQIRTIGSPWTTVSSFWDQRTS